MTTAPMNPLAGPAGPGKFSTRTDKLSMPSQYYGEGVETASIQSGAPLAKTKDVSASPMVGLYAPTQRPNEPITSGIDRGAGVGSNALMMQKSNVKTSDTLAKLLPFDTDGSIGILYQQALANGD